MKKLLLLLLLAATSIGYAQPYNNSWINYGKTYYKFNVGSAGLYRVSQSVLASSGLSTIPAEQFQLWRNGEQVRIYTSVVSGPLGSGGYFEFWGLANDGKVDNRLFLNPSFQLSDQLSLQTDTSAYFLTVNSSSPNLRYSIAANNVAGTTLTPESFFMNRVRVNYRNQINPGFARPVGPYVYSSSYDSGEGWSSADISPSTGITHTIPNLNLFTTGPAASFKIAASGNALNFRTIRVNLFNTNIITATMNQFDIARVENNNIPLSVFQSPDALTVNIQNGAGIATDRMVVSHFEVRYPSKWNFNAQNNFSFELPASVTGNYLVIDNFNYGSQAPALLDMNSGARYIGDIATAGKVKFVLPASVDTLRKFILTSIDGSATRSITGLITRNFINYSLPANQSGYMIISHSNLFNNGAGINYVEQYRAYRASAAGGSYNAKIYNIDELVDQFAYGIKKHPIAVKDFVQFAKNTFAPRPAFLFIIGKGLAYNDYRSNENVVGSLAESLNLVPSFGYPASDNLLSSDYYKFVPEIPIGRLAAINGNEVAIYLDKMKQFEQAQVSTSQTVADKAWMKNIIHVIGGATTQESDLFKGYMDVYKDIIEDTFYGGKVETFAKSSTAAVQIALSQRIEDLFREGLSLVGYFGHSSANTLEFNLNSPELYQNQGKYPLFNVSGCTAGNIFIYDPLRPSGNLNLSEKYVLSPQRGSIGFLASTHLGIPPYLNNYNIQLYTAIGLNQYDRSIGEHIKRVVQDLAPNPASLEFFTRMHVEQILLHGDPALKVNPHPKPDYIIEEPMVRINPSIISVADNSFTINVKMLNIGKAIKDSIRVTVKRILPDNSIVSLYDKLIPAIRYMDSVNLIVPINPITDKGQNKIVVTLDVNNRVTETSESNNTVTKDFFIFEDEIRPVYPYNFSIITQQGNLFYGSTANPLTGLKSIVMEIDTTELFNSPFKKIVTTASLGGLIQFNPGVTYTDNTVYYWRVSIVPVTGNIIWNNSSFLYLANGSKGFNQSHYYQHLKSTYSQMSLQPNRKFTFNTIPRNLNIKTGLFPYFDYDVINVNLDFQQVEQYGCEYNSLQFMVFDSSTLNAWDNYNNPSNTFGRFGSRRVCDQPVRKFFEFPFGTASYRKSAMDFLDSIPAGHFVSLTNIGNINNTSFINQWIADQTILGPGNSIYHKLKSLGFTQIDSFTRNRPFIFFFQKGVPSFVPRQKMGLNADEYLNENYALSTRYKNGTIWSPVFGPAKAWKELHWRGTDLEPAVPDSVSVEIHGVTQTGNTVLLATVRPARDTSISFINPVIYPFIKLKMNNADNVLATAHQLSYWRLNADYVPEGAVAPNITFKMKDTVDVGEGIDFELAFKNISETAFDSLKVKFVITNRNNVDSPLIIPRQKRLLVGEVLTISYRIDTRSFPGNNRLYVEVNPDNDQPEQYHFNNFIYKNFYVRPDKVNPLLDVTFDGVHILNRDIVSAKPHIVIKLKDESRFLALNDTSLLKVQIRYPDPSGSGNGILRTYYFDQDTMKFTPATIGAGGENSATIDLTPYLPGDDEEYELIVSGKDVSGNSAGELQYRVSFRVINKPMISNLLNYPNPFTSSTAFVFTVTGSQPPQNMRIQILTVTGKVVREITRDELGPIRVGRNITEFKWDGTDQYGSKLANGVYLYRVITNLNGVSLEKYKVEGDKTDKFFNKGYGKMYLLR